MGVRLMMSGKELRSWRQFRGWKQADLMSELEVSSRQTISTWESMPEVPRIVELAVIALDQVEACRKLSGFEKQWTPEIIGKRRNRSVGQYFPES
jgi:transcriptional regulator with XRE-family HTH domain